MSKQPASGAGTAPLFKNDVLHLAFCVVGVVGSLLLYGVLQVRGGGSCGAPGAVCRQRGGAWADLPAHLRPWIVLRRSAS